MRRRPRRHRATDWLASRPVRRPRSSVCTSDKAGLCQPCMLSGGPLWGVSSLFLHILACVAYFNAYICHIHRVNNQMSAFGGVLFIHGPRATRLVRAPQPSSEAQRARGVPHRDAGPSRRRLLVANGLPGARAWRCATRPSGHRLCSVCGLCVGSRQPVEIVSGFIVGNSF